LLILKRTILSSNIESNVVTERSRSAAVEQYEALLSVKLSAFLPLAFLLTNAGH